ncbi:hypothetical protein NSERUTF1_0412 [Nocardia seriolae]|nr:hypothetical protein NSERUTF1_0412 [Nocardia seriolae]
MYAPYAAGASGCDVRYRCQRRLYRVQCPRLVRGDDVAPDRDRV